MSIRDVVEGVQHQGVDEKIAYKITTTPWASTPVIVDVMAYDITDGDRTDVTLTLLTGAASVLGDVITTPIVQPLAVDKLYRIEVKFTSGGNTLEFFFVVKSEY